MDLAENAEKLSDGAVWRLQTNAVRLALTEERQEREELPDRSFSPATPENTPKEVKHEALQSCGLSEIAENIFPDPEGAAKGVKYVIETEDGSISTARLIGD